MVAHLIETPKMTIYKNEKSAGLDEEICSFHAAECLIPPALLCMHACVLNCAQLCDPMDCSLPGSSVYGIFQAGILEWVSISSCRGTF